MDAHDYYLHSRSEVAALLPVVGDDLRVLEIGCGEGHFRRHLKDECEYWGIEPFAGAATVAAGRLRRVLVGTFREMQDQLPDKHFDCVVCNDVIEHMDDHDWFLEVIKAKMRPGAAIVGSIPNVRHISNLIRLVAHRDWKYVESGILDKTHLRFFTERSLKRTFIAHDYVIEAFRGINDSSMAEAGTLKDRAIELGKLVLSVVAGADTRYPQFAFRVRSLGTPAARDAGVRRD